MTRHVLPCATGLLFALAATAAAADRTQANPGENGHGRAVVPIDGSWIVLDELMSEGDFYAPLFSYTSPQPIQIDVTDLFVVSDRNEVYLDGVLLGATPAVPDWQSLSPAVGPLDAPYTDDPDLAWLAPEFSKQSFLLPAGSHVLTLRNIHIPLDEDGDAYTDGTVAFRLVPEPSTALLLCGGLSLLVLRSRGRRRRPELGLLVLPLLLSVPPAARATPCGAVDADVVTGVLEITGTTGNDDIRVSIQPGNPDVIEIFTPASSSTPACAYDATVTPFGTIRIVADDGDDLIVIDDSNGTVAATWILDIDGGAGEETVLAGIDLSTTSLSAALNMISTLQQAQQLIDRVIDLLDDPVAGCDTVPCLVDNTISVVEGAVPDVIVPTAQYVRDIESDLVQPSAQAVRDAHNRIGGYVQSFLAGDVPVVADDAQVLTADVEVMVDEFELLLPVADALLLRAEALYHEAARLGLETQSGDSIEVFIQTVESHITTIEELGELCPEDPEPTETEFDEDLQDPSGLPGLCAELERRIEALEALTDGVEANVDALEAEGDAVEADGDQLDIDGRALGDDEEASSDAAQIIAQGDQLVLTGEGLSATADTLAADWNAWVGGVEADLESRGDTHDTRGHVEVLAAADTLEVAALADVAAVADAIRTEAEQIAADLDALLIVAAPLLRDDLAFIGGGGGPGGNGGCPVTPLNIITGGPGNDILIGSPLSDELSGGDDSDLLIGAGGADRLFGGDGIDLLFGGGGDDEIHGGDKIDLIVGNAGDDCLFGNGGQTVTAGTFSVELGDLFFGLDGDDNIVSGTLPTDTIAGIDFAMGGAGNDWMRLSDGGTLTVGTFSFQFGNLAFGGPGDDDILTGDGVDLLFGGPDDDTLQAGAGYLFSLGSGSGAFRIGLGDLLFGGTGDDTLHGDDPDADRDDDDIDLLFGGDDNDEINAYGGAVISFGSVSNPDFELRLGNLVFGGDGDDEIEALDGIDLVFCGAGDDTAVTGVGDVLEIGSGSSAFRLALGDLLFGRGGADTLHGDDPDADRDDDDIDVIFGGDDNDTVHGYGGGLLTIGDSSAPDFELRLGNVLFGGDGNDEIDALDGIDLVFCGIGNDTAAAGAGHLLEIDSSFSIDLGDLIFGQDGDDVLHGDAPTPPTGGDDDGIDLIFGGEGDDRAYGGTGGVIEVPAQDFCLLFGNLLFGGPDNDTLRGDYLNWDTSDLEGGIDLAFGAGGDDTIEGSAGTLIIVGNISTGQAVVIAFGNLLFGGPGDDIIRGADSPDVCTGVSGELDTLMNNLGLTDLGGAADLIFAGDGHDTVDAFDGIDFVFGSTGDDILRGDDGGFIIVPISGVPTPIALGNLIFAGDGEDIVRSLGRIGLITVPPLETDLLFGGPCDDDISAGDGFNLVFGGRADDLIVAGDGINLLFGNVGEDDITAGSGLNVAFGNADDDRVVANDGVNVLFGGNGNDDVIGDDGLNVGFGNKGDDLVQGGNGLNVLFGNSGIDQVTGGAGLSVLFGNRGKDSVSAGSGLAVLFGNRGNDEVSGAHGLCVGFGNADHDIVTAGAGLNVLFGNSGEDRIRSGSGLSVLFGSSSNDIVQAGGSGLYIAFGNSDSDVILGGGGLNLLFGNNGDDQFFGGGGVNIAFGNRENDVIRGGGSADLLFGNRGNDQIDGGGARDFIFGNRDNDQIVTGAGKDFAFGNRGNDILRSGGDGSDKDRLFGNRGDDDLFGCNNDDRLFGGRGSDNKTRNDCGGLTLPAPARGEVRGRIMIDVNGDSIGDVPHAGVTVTAGSSSAVTDADGCYRIASLAPGSYTVNESVPSGFDQIVPASSYSISVGSQGIDLSDGRDFVNRADCFIAPDGWGCLGGGCDPLEPGCQPVAVRAVLRCAETGAICDDPEICPCGDCIPSWEVVECECNPDCYIIFDQNMQPTCSACLDPSGNMVPCDLVEQGGIYRCVCPDDPNEGCPTDLALFEFSGTVSSVLDLGIVDPPWDTVSVGDPWTARYWFIRSTGDLNGDPSLGDYPGMIYYELQIGSAFSAGPLAPPSTLIRNGSMFAGFDAYEAGWPLDASGITAFLQLRDSTQTAWTIAGLSPRDALPLCPDMVLERFPRRLFRLENLFNPASEWQIVGSVESFLCEDCSNGPPMRQPGGRRIEGTPDAQQAGAPVRQAGTPRQP